MQFQPGADWSEAAAGTNAVGTAAALDHALQIFSAEHLVAAVHPWTCSAAPIHDPTSGALIGVIDLTADLRTAHPHTLSLAMLAAQAAESKLRQDAIERESRASALVACRTVSGSALLGNRAGASFAGGVERGLRSLELLARARDAPGRDDRRAARARALRRERQDGDDSRPGSPGAEPARRAHAPDPPLPADVPDRGRLDPCVTAGRRGAHPGCAARLSRTAAARHPTRRRSSRRGCCSRNRYAAAC